MTDSTKEKIIATIIDETDPAWVDNILKKHPGDFYGEAGIEEKQTQKEYRQLTRLDSIADHLEGENKKFYDKLLEKYKKPSPIPEEGVIVTSWEGPESPIKLEELSKKSINEVVQDLINYLPLSKDTFGTHSREGLGRILEEDVQNRASDYADNALLFINENMHFVYYTHFFRGLEAAVKNQMRFTLTNVITIFEYITNQESDEFEKQEDEEGLPVAQLAVASLLGELLRIKDPGIGENLLERIGKIIIDLFAKKDPFLGNETDSGFDPAMRSLNSIHGMSMHCIVLYGLYSERKRKKDKGGEGEPVMVPLVKEILTEKLDKTKYPSQAIHSVFGWYFTQFIYLDKEWALENRERIFPTEPEMAKYWQAAWGAYLQFSDIYTNVFPALIKQYRKALEELSTIGRNKNLQRLDEKIATHILKAYLLDMIKMDSEDCLILSYYKNANDETRSYGNFWLSQAMDAQKPSIHDARWVRIWNLWQWRIKEAITSENRSNYVKEISNFCRLLKYAPVDLSEMYPILKQTLGFVSKSYEVGLIINYLGENSEKYPNLAISLLHEIILSGQSIYLIEDSKNSIRKIIISIPYSDLESRAKAIEIINVFGERGDYEWRSLLIGLSE